MKRERIVPRSWETFTQGEQIWVVSRSARKRKEWKFFQLHLNPSRKPDKIFRGFNTKKSAVKALRGVI
jgi:hypothetical protein